MQRIDGVLHIENDQRLGFCWQLMRRALLFIGKLKLVAIFPRQCLIVSHARYCARAKPNYDAVGVSVCDVTLRLATRWRLCVS